MKMEVGMPIFAETNAEFLNQLLNTNYKRWMRSSIKLPDGKLLWMIELNGSVSSSNWANLLVNSHVISELHVGEEYEHKCHGTYLDAKMRKIYWDSSDRVVFEKTRNYYKRRQYIFRGVFRLCKDSCSVNENIWERISDKYNF